jgi:ABC-type amino acid transport substrate-binding protein
VRARPAVRFIADLPVERGEGIGVALRKSDAALRARFDAAIDKVVADGTYDRIGSSTSPST